MHPSRRARLFRILGATGLLAALLLPAAAPAAAADPVVLRVGTTQDLDSLNPYATILVVGYEAFGSPTTTWSTPGPTSSPSRASPTSGSEPPMATPGRSTSGTA